MTRLPVKIALGAFLAVAAIAAAKAQSNDVAIENPFRGVMQDRSASSADEALYVEKCSMCHRRLGMGTVILGRRLDPQQAELEARANLTPQFIELAVRQGIGNMPRIGRAEVSDEQLGRIAKYLTNREAR